MAGGFDSLGLMSELVRGVDDLGWLLPTDVQDEAIPLILGGGDVMVASETGSGKTAAFGLPVLQCVHERLRQKLEQKSQKSQPSKSSATQRNVLANIEDKDSLLTLDDSGLECDCHSDKQWAGVRATHGVRSGKFYFECHVSGDGICRVGWSTKSASLELGKDSHGYGYGGTGKKSTANTYLDYGGKYGNGDMIGCLVDMENGKISYRKNGRSLGDAFDISDIDRQSVLFPAVLIKKCKVSLNFGNRPFKFSPTAEYKSLVAGSAKDIVDASSNELHFQSLGEKRKPMALVLLPAKDLAEQVYESIRGFAQYLRDPAIESALLIGGGNDKAVKNALRDGVDIVVGTPTKVQDFVQQGRLDLSMVHFFILDEADKLVEQDTLPTVLKLFNACPSFGKGEHRLQVCFFSATLHSDAIKSLTAKICKNPTWVDLKGKDAIPDSVHHVVYRIDISKPIPGTRQAKAVTDGVHLPNSSSSKEQNSQKIKEMKQHALLNIVDKFNMSQCIIFCRTNVDCNNLETFLCSQDEGMARAQNKKFRGIVESGKEIKYSCCVLAGMRSMEQRRESLAAFKEGNVRFLICTDVAARGIDITGLPYVINMTLPDEAEQYIHRIGRVGRAERMGLAISIVGPEGVDEKVWYHKCNNRGKDGCARRQLTSEGGCTIWYNESLYFQNIQKRLDMALPSLRDDFSLPEELSSLGVEYGEVSQQNAQASSSNFHFDLLQPAMHDLVSMELEAQNIFLSYKNDFLGK